jgi:hypothetical protein
MDNNAIPRNLQEKIIFDNYTEEFAQNEDQKNQALLNIQRRIDIGELTVYESGGIVFLLERVEKYIGHLDIFSNNRKISFAEHGRLLVDRIFSETDYQILIGWVSNPKWIRVAEGGGFKYLGILEKCGVEGEELIDQHMFCVPKQRFYDFLAKKPISV